MGVYIKGIDIPKSCMKCEIGFTYELSEICPFAKNPIGGYKEKRHEDCPLVEVKEPHGRLIDADAVDTSYSDPEVVETLREAPTIIEAEG